MCGCLVVGSFRREQLPFGCQANGCVVPAAGCGFLATGDKEEVQQRDCILGMSSGRRVGTRTFFKAASSCERGIIVSTQAMKPTGPSVAGKKRFPQTDYCFHVGFGQWRGWSPYDGEDRSAFRNFYNLGRQFRIEAARHRREITEQGAAAGVNGLPFRTDFFVYCFGRGQRNSSRYSGALSGAKPWRVMFSVTTRGRRKCSR